MLAYHLFSFLYMYVACIFTFWFFNRIFSVFPYSGTNHLNYCNCITLLWNFSVRKFREATWDLLRLYFKSLKYHLQLNYSKYLGCINPLHWALSRSEDPFPFLLVACAFVRLGSLSLAQQKVAFNFAFFLEGSLRHLFSVKQMLPVLALNTSNNEWKSLSGKVNVLIKTFSTYCLIVKLGDTRWLTQKKENWELS